MAEYIEREKAFDAVFGQFCASSDEIEAALNAAIEEIKSIPAADVRPVVLCRDCKCYQQSHYIGNHMECARSGVPVHSVDFCSFGKKREES